MIAVFAYAFPHRKSCDILVEIALSGEREVCVIAAPFEQLPAMDRTTYIPKTLQDLKPQDTATVAKRLGFDYVEVSHSDIEALNGLVAEKDLRVGIIAGARILKRPIIEAFPEGIVNFHPGKIPETSGLDAFFYTIKTGVDAGVTTHFIDPRVDAGQRLYFDAVELGSDDSVDIVLENSYKMQITALRRFLADRKAGRLDPAPVDRPIKNQPMAPEQKWEMLLRFPAWRTERHLIQTANKLHTACIMGEVNQAAALLDRYPSLLEALTPEGWSPLILAAYHQRLEIVELLLVRGADVNAIGRKGTSVLMYAKTALMEVEAPDTVLLDLLIAHGADPKRCDMYGRNLLHYIASSPALTRYFTNLGAID